MEFRNNQRGFMMAEIMISLGLLGFSALVLYSGTSYMSNNLSLMKQNRQSTDIMTEMINTFSSSAQLLQVNYSPNATLPSELPIAWDSNGEKMLVKDCIEPCHLKGRMGILVTPTPSKKFI